MKIVGNLDTTGNIKLHGEVLDKFIATGGFYSRQYGEAAYKSEIPTEVSAGEVNFFYGLGVRTSDGVHNFKGINSLTFMGDNFYIEGNNLATDEIFVTLGPLKTARYVELNTNTVANTGDTLQTVCEHTVKAGRLQVGNCCEISIYGTEISTLATAGFYYNMYFENRLVYKMNIDHPHLTPTTVHDWQHKFTIAQTDQNEGYIYWNWKASEGTITAPTTGDSDLADDQESTLASSIAFYSGPNLDRLFQFKVRAESRTSTYTKFHETVEYW